MTPKHIMATLLLITTAFAWTNNQFLLSDDGRNTAYYLSSSGTEIQELGYDFDWARHDNQYGKIIIKDGNQLMIYDEAMSLEHNMTIASPSFKDCIFWDGDTLLCTAISSNEPQLYTVETASGTTALYWDTNEAYYQSLNGGNCIISLYDVFISQPYWDANGHKRVFISAYTQNARSATGAVSPATENYIFDADLTDKSIEGYIETATPSFHATSSYTYYQGYNRVMFNTAVDEIAFCGAWGTCYRKEYNATTPASGSTISSTYLTEIDTDTTDGYTKYGARGWTENWGVWEIDDANNYLEEYQASYRTIYQDVTPSDFDDAMMFHTYLPAGYGGVGGIEPEGYTIEQCDDIYYSLDGRKADCLTLYDSAYTGHYYTEPPNTFAIRIYNEDGTDLQTGTLPATVTITYLDGATTIATQTFPLTTASQVDKFSRGWYYIQPRVDSNGLDRPTELIEELTDRAYITITIYDGTSQADQWSIMLEKEKLTPQSSNSQYIIMSNHYERMSNYCIDASRYYSGSIADSITTLINPFEAWEFVQDNYQCSTYPAEEGTDFNYYGVMTAPDLRYVYDPNNPDNEIFIWTPQAEEIQIELRGLAKGRIAQQLNGTSYCNISFSDDNVTFAHTRNLSLGLKYYQTTDLAGALNWGYGATRYLYAQRETPDTVPANNTYFKISCEETEIFDAFNLTGEFNSTATRGWMLNAPQVVRVWDLPETETITLDIIPDIAVEEGAGMTAYLNETLYGEWTVYVQDSLAPDYAHLTELDCEPTTTLWENENVTYLHCNGTANFDTWGYSGEMETLPFAISYYKVITPLNETVYFGFMILNNKVYDYLYGDSSGTTKIVDVTMYTLSESTNIVTVQTTAQVDGDLPFKTRYTFYTDEVAEFLLKTTKSNQFYAGLSTQSDNFELVYIGDDQETAYTGIYLSEGMSTLNVQVELLDISGNVIDTYDTVMTIDTTGDTPAFLDQPTDMIGWALTHPLETLVIMIIGGFTLMIVVRIL